MRKIIENLQNSLSKRREYNNNNNKKNEIEKSVEKVRRKKVRQSQSS